MFNLLIVCLMILCWWSVPPACSQDAQVDSTKTLQEGDVIQFDDPELEEGDVIKFDDPELEEGDVIKFDDPELQEGDILDLSDPELEEGDVIRFDDPELDDTTPEVAEPVKQKPSLRDRLDALPFRLQGFWSARGGIRTQDDPNQSKDLMLGETRLQIEAGKSFDRFDLAVKSDFLYDAYLEEADVDLREATLLLLPNDWLDVKIGRQILTWGVTDLVFINDLFPKDWHAYFNGRDVTYLKAPSDAVRATMLTSLAQINIVYTPQFDPDRYLDGERISFFDPFFGVYRGEDNPLPVEEPDEWFEDDEIAWRLQRNISGYGLNLYGYDGFWKSPAGLDGATGKYTFPALRVYGLSVQGPLHKGIASLEAGCYDSHDDPDGDDPMINNNEVRIMLGYTQDLITDLSLGLQYYAEHTLQHDKLLSTLPPGASKPDETYHLLTLRLTQLLLRQNLTLSLFTFYSPSDEDAYLRPKVSCKLTDDWRIEAGGHFLIGTEQTTFFGQLEQDSNVFAGVRWNF